MFLTIISIFYNTVLYILSSIDILVMVYHSGVHLSLNAGLIGVIVYYLTRLKKPDERSEHSIFGPVPGTQESELHPEKVVTCIAHRGAALDAPENTLEAFKYCIDESCKFIEFDVRSSKDGKLVLLHDAGLERIATSDISDIRLTNWEEIKDIDVGAKHPNRVRFKKVRLCLLDEALDYLVDKQQARVIIDIKGKDKEVVDGVLKVYSERPELHKYAAITCFDPFVLYAIRKKNPKIVGAISYRPHIFSAVDYDAENGPKYRFEANLAKHAAARCLDWLHARLWRWSARWCGVSAVFVHKDIVSLKEVQYWRGRGVRCAGWCVNRPLEKLYWRGILKAPYLANTLLGETEMEDRKSPEKPAQSS